MLSLKLDIPEVFPTRAGDAVNRSDALAMLCYRLSYPGKLCRLRKEFGRSDSSVCRIVLDLADYLVEIWAHILYFNSSLLINRHQMYCDAVRDKTEGMVTNVSLFIDGTKCGICRPGVSAERLNQLLDGIEIGDQLNLQRACYSGHKRKHCLNYQAINSPDGKNNFILYVLLSQ